MRKNKIKYLLILLAIIGIQTVKAEDTFGNSLTCIYGEEKDVENQIGFMITIDHADAIPYVEEYVPDSMQGFFLSVIEGHGIINGKFSNPEIIQYYEKIGIIVDSGTQYGKMFSCPSDTSIFNSNYVVPFYEKSFGNGPFIGSITPAEEKFTCEYKSNLGNELSIKSVWSSEEWYYDVTYNGETKRLNGTEVNGNFMPSKECDDVYYDHDTGLIKLAIELNEGMYTDNVTLLNYCSSKNGDISGIEHFCSGDCNFKDYSCKKEYSACGGMNDIPLALPQFIKNIINILKIIVPIVLIILGMLDFGKAVTSNDEKGMKEAQNKFVKRVIASVLIFLVVTVVQFIFRVINTDDTNEMASCIDCFINGNCKTVYTLSDIKE